MTPEQRARLYSAQEQVEIAECAWRNAIAALAAASDLTCGPSGTQLLAAVRLGADKARDVEPWDVGAVLSVLRARVQERLRA